MWVADTIYKIGWRDMENTAIGKRIRRARKNMGLTQEELGRLVNADGKYICRLETGRSLPNLRKLVQLSRVLECSCDYFIGDMDVDEQEDFLCDETDMYTDREGLEFLDMIQEFADTIGDFVNSCRATERCRQSDEDCGVRKQ